MQNGDYAQGIRNAVIDIVKIIRGLKSVVLKVEIAGLITATQNQLDAIWRLRAKNLN